MADLCFATFSVMHGCPSPICCLSCARQCACPGCRAYVERAALRDEDALCADGRRGRRRAEGWASAALQDADDRIAWETGQRLADEETP